MNLTALKSLTKQYLTDFNDWGEAARYKHTNEAVEIEDQIERCSVHSHVLWMLGQMVDMNDHDKLNRWLGFVQGVLWVMGVRTIDELRKEVMRASNAP